MPYKRNDSPVWWASFTDAGGKRIRRSTGTTDRREAEALEAKWKVEAYRSRQWDETPVRTFDELMLDYLKATRDKRSHRRDCDAARHLSAFFRGRDLGALSGQDVRAYVARRKAEEVSNGTVNRELCLLSAAVNFANREWEWQLPNPVSGRKLKEPEGRVRWLTRAEAAALIRMAEQEANAPHLADFIRLALNTGCRKQELLGLEWRRVDLQAGLIRLEAEHTKSGKRRSVPLNAEARAVIIGRARFRAQHCPASPWVFAHPDGSRIQDVKRSFATACRRSGIEDFRIHDLRHTCAAWLVTAGVPLTEVRDLLGHSTVMMTERYAHLAPENVREAVRKLEGLSRSGHADDHKNVVKSL
jgi:integrase